MRLHKRIWVMHIDGHVSGLFQTLKAASNARNGILAAFEFRGEEPPEIICLKKPDFHKEK